MKTRCFVLALLLVGCGGDPETDGGVSPDAGAGDAGIAEDAGTVDASTDAGAPRDAGRDAGPDLDAGPDGGVDGGPDAGPPRTDRLFDVAEIIDGLPPGARLFPSFAGDAARDAISALRDEADPSLRRVTLYVNEAGVFRETATMTMTSFGVDVANVSDFDGDGVRDVALLRRDSPGRFWRILYMAGDGTVARSEEVEGEGDRAGFADWNADGKTDIVLRQADGLDDDLRIWRSNPSDDGHTVLDLGRTFTDEGFVAGDFDGDTRLDVVALPDQIYLQGPSGFGAPSTLAVCTRCEDGAAADLNGDGRDDLVAAELRVGSEGSVYVLEANADGSFRTHATLRIDQPRRVVLADVDGDTEMDLVVSDGLRRAAGGAKVIEVLYGAGLDFTGDRRRFGNDTAWEDVEVFDLDGDGNHDLITNGRFVTYGDGRVMRAPSVSFWDGPSGSPRVARFDGDTRPDAVFLLTGGDTRFRAMQPDRTLGDDVNCTHPGPRVAERLLDVNGDGRLDALHFASAEVDVWINRGGCDLAPVVTSAITPRPFGIEPVDVTGDGNVDLVWREDDTLEVALGTGSGGFGSVVSTDVSAGAGVLLPGRFTDDDDVDLFNVSISTSTVTAMIGDGDGGFTEGAATLVPSLTNAFVADADGDGDGDLFTVARPSSGTTVVALHRNEAGVLASPVELVSLGGFPLQVQAADLNGDGAAELFTVDAEIAEIRDLTGASPEVLQRFPLTDSAVIVDADDDGDLDLIPHDERSNRHLLVVLQNRSVD